MAHRPAARHRHRLFHRPPHAIPRHALESPRPTARPAAPTPNPTPPQQDSAPIEFDSQTAEFNVDHSKKDSERSKKDSEQSTFDSAHTKLDVHTSKKDSWTSTKESQRSTFNSQHCEFYSHRPDLNVHACEPLSQPAPQLRRLAKPNSPRKTQRQTCHLRPPDLDFNGIRRIARCKAKPMPSAATRRRGWRV